MEKNKKIDILVSSLVYAVYMLLSCLIIMCAEILAIKIINLFVVTDYYSLCITRAVIYTLGVNALLAIISYREGYRTASFPILQTVISGIIASLLHFIFALLFSFEAFCAGGVKFITALVRFGSKLNSNTFMGELDRFDFIPFFFINAAIYIAIIIVFGKLGESQRLYDREELTSTSSDNG